jgi:hypothetical protein
VIWRAGAQVWKREKAARARPDVGRAAESCAGAVGGSRWGPGRMR